MKEVTAYFDAESLHRKTSPMSMKKERNIKSSLKEAIAIKKESTYRKAIRDRKYDDN